MRYALALAVVLSVTWLLLSGHYDPLLLSFGAASVVAVVAVAFRMRIVDEEGVPLHIHSPSLVGYLAWLVWQVVVSNLDVARRIWSPSRPISPRMLLVKPSQRTAAGRVLYANSITLTPGTVSVRMYDGEILVHALHQQSADDVASGDMDRRVSGVEWGGGR